MNLSSWFRRAFPGAAVGPQGVAEEAYEDWRRRADESEIERLATALMRARDAMRDAVDAYDAPMTLESALAMSKAIEAMRKEIA